MGLFDFLFGKKEETELSCILGVGDVIGVDDNATDLIIEGFVEGTLKVGDEMIVTKMSCLSETPVKTVITSIYVNEEEVQEASEKVVKVTVKDGDKLGIYKGTVLHSENVTDTQVYYTYRFAMDIAFVKQQDGILTEEDREKLAASDISEIWSLYWKAHLEDFKRVKEIELKVDQRRRDFFNLIREKLFLLDDLYVIYSTITNEPHLFATASLDGNKGMTVSHSWVYLIPSSYMHYRKEIYKKDERYDFKRIENGPEKEGIRNFLRDLFIYDGVESILYFTEDTVIFAKELMDLLNYEGVDEAEIPVTNPNLMKFLHLSSQLDGIEDKEQKNIGKAYFYLFARFTKTAKFIAPMRLHGYDQLLEDNPQTDTEPNIPFNLAIQQGKTKEKAVQVYTDWKRLRKHFGEEYKGLVVTVDELIKDYDVVINPGEYPIAELMTEEFFNAVD
jgi:hypothetical protein